MVVVVRLVAVVAGVALALGAAPADARPAPERATASWQGLDVWHFNYLKLQGRNYPFKITFRGNKLTYPRQGVVAIAATADAAIVQVNDYEQRTRLGQLVELPATGQAGRRLDRHPLGTVIAAPTATWRSGAASVRTARTWSRSTPPPAPRSSGRP